MAPHEVREIIARLRAAYPDPPLAEETEKLYARMLADLDYQEVDEAVDELIATVMRLPTISRIRRTVIEPKLRLPTADEAWVAVQSRGEMSHELVRQTVGLMGGSYTLRTSANPELSRIRFVKLYEDLRRRAVDDALVASVRARRMQRPAA